LAELRTALDAIDGGDAGDWPDLAQAVRAHALPTHLLRDLLSAFEQDVVTPRYASFDSLLDYCRRSANPIGRLLLVLYRRSDAERAAWSDAICTALQLTNFWQDFGRDWRAGRLYVPREVLDASGASEADLGDHREHRLNRAWKEALARCVAVTEEQFALGREVCDGVRGRLRLELRLTWLGGRRILERVDAARAELFDYRPTLGARDVPALIGRAAAWGVRS
jgi:squalene synthase HpnC